MSCCARLLNSREAIHSISEIYPRRAILPFPRQGVSETAGEGNAKERQERRDRWCGTIKALLAQRANICAMPIWRTAHGRILTSSRWHRRAANEARDTASLWKRRGLTSILKRYVRPPRPIPLYQPCRRSPPLPRPVSPPGIAGALHLPAPFKARNSTRWLAPIPEVRERRRRDEGSRWTSTAGKRNSPSLVIRAITLVFNRRGAIFGSDTPRIWVTDVRITRGIVAKSKFPRI